MYSIDSVAHRRSKGSEGHGPAVTSQELLSSGGTGLLNRVLILHETLRGRREGVQIAFTCGSSQHHCCKLQICTLAYGGRVAQVPYGVFCPTMVRPQVEVQP